MWKYERLQSLLDQHLQDQVHVVLNYVKSAMVLKESLNSIYGSPR